MTRNPVIVGPNDSIRKARLLMRQGHVRRLPVVEDRRVVGIVTDRDIWERSPATSSEQQDTDGSDLADHLRVMGMMTLRPVTIPVTTSVVEAARRMRESRVGSLLVLEEGALVGILTKSDLIDALLEGYSAAPVNASRS
ncbi:MAG TPA: CBS domain-containing protein [Candidatus Margulisiibacteriota bacterium]|nr:CBS domain-containing protein [Candidatus Margulisiibacteriota bacterium]